MHNEDDYCELDPAKLCDNCCKCLGKDEAYRIVRADMMLADMPAEDPEDAAALFSQAEAAEEELPEGYLSEVALPLDADALEEDEAEDEFEFGRNVPPLEIDPKLLAEWEAKLAGIGQSEQSVPGLRGIRRKRTR